MSDTQTASRQIIDAVGSWPGVDVRPNRRGALAFFVDRRELGHLHGDRVLHTAFPKALWNELHDQGRIAHHPIFPDREGPASRRIEDEADIADVIALLRLNYERGTGTRSAQTAASAPSSTSAST